MTLNEFCLNTGYHRKYAIRLRNGPRPEKQRRPRERRHGLSYNREVLPFALLGVDSDKGSEFINGHLKTWCDQEKIQRARGRPYQKDDNAHVEQKDGTPVRKLLCWER